MQYVVCLGINKFPVREMRHVLSKWHPVVEESEDLHPFFLYWFPQCLKRITRNNSLNDLNGFNSIQAIFWFLISFLECIVTYFLLVYIFKANIKIWNLKSVTLKTYSSFHSLSFFFYFPRVYTQNKSWIFKIQIFIFHQLNCIYLIIFRSSDSIIIK